MRIDRNKTIGETVLETPTECVCVTVTEVYSKFIGFTVCIICRAILLSI